MSKNESADVSGPLTHPHLVIAPLNSYPWHVFIIPFSSVLL